jgi:hypothetical protein
MRSKLVALLLVILLMIVVRPLLADDQSQGGKMTADQLRAKIEEIDAKCSACAASIEDLQALKASLLKELGEGAPQPPAKRSSWAEKVAVTGYFQNRAEEFSAKAATPPITQVDKFYLRRLYVSIVAKTSDRSQAVVQVASDGPFVHPTMTNWASVYSDYALGHHDTVRFGQAPTWFGIEAWQSSSQRLPFERAAFLEGGNGGKPFGMFGAGPWDRGIWWIHTPPHDSWAPQTILAVENGAFRNDPAINNKTVEADLKWAPKWGMFGFSWLNGTFFQVPPIPALGNWFDVTYPIPGGAYVPGWASATKMARDAMLGYVRVQQSPKTWAFQSEIMAGEMNMHSVSGWYGQLELPIAQTPGTAFAKYETFNTDTDAPTGAIYQAWTLGYAHQLDNNNRLTAERTWGSNGTAPSATQGGWAGSGTLNETGVQWQYSF